MSRPLAPAMRTPWTIFPTKTAAGPISDCCSLGFGRFITQLWGHMSSVTGCRQPSKNLCRVSDTWIPPRGVYNKQILFIVLLWFSKTKKLNFTRCIFLQNFYSVIQSKIKPRLTTWRPLNKHKLTRALIKNKLLAKHHLLLAADWGALMLNSISQLDECCQLLEEPCSSTEK